MDAATARADADANGATGYCRPEDLHIDRESPRFNGGDGILWCWTNTCAGGDENGEVLCATESDETVEANDMIVDANFPVGTMLLNFTSNPLDGRTDDLIKITGFMIPGSGNGGEDDDD